MNELTITARVENIPAVTAFVDQRLEALDCPVKAQMQIDIAIDELFGNIAHYAYRPGVGPATVRVEVVQDPLSVVITFIDQGPPMTRWPRRTRMSPCPPRSGRSAAWEFIW